MIDNVNKIEEYLRDSLIALETIRAITKKDEHSEIINVFLQKMENSLVKVAECNLEITDSCGKPKSRCIFFN